MSKCVTKTPVNNVPERKSEVPIKPDAPAPGTAEVKEASPPPKCSLCNSKKGPFRYEERLTGKKWQGEIWPFCAACWKLLRTQKSSTNREIYTRYLVFLQFLTGYRMQQSFHEKRGTKTAPNPVQAQNIRRVKELLKKIEDASQ